MRILFAHQEFPGQFLRLCEALAREGEHELVFMSRPNENRIRGVRVVYYDPIKRTPAGVHPAARDIDYRVRMGEEAAKKAAELKTEGFAPDIIIGHGAWGELLFLRDIYPAVPILSLFEFFFDAALKWRCFDPEFPPPNSHFMRTRMSNVHDLIGATIADWGVSATEWQRSTYPAALRSRISVIHEGVDTDYLKPNDQATLRLQDGRKIAAGDQIVTYVSRDLEPLRGFHSFIRAVPEIVRRCPNAIIAIVGGNGTSYGVKHESGLPWREVMLREVKGLDPRRVWFLGRVSFSQLASLFQISAAHVYLTYPFVLSWSMLQAMACGCALVASSTEPVREIIRDGENGVLVDFFDVDALACSVVDILRRPTDFIEMRSAARQSVVDRYDFKRQSLPMLRTLIHQLIDRQTPTVGL